MNYFILFFFGAAIGSFLNVLSLRYKEDQKILDLKIIGGRSHCPHCGKQLKWYELLPIFSFIIQLGKCRSCGTRLSFQYPIVEILSGLIFVFVSYSIFQSFNPSIFQLIIWLLIFTLFLLLSIIDFRIYIIPDSINLLLAILGIVLIALSANISSFLGHYSLLFGFQNNIWFNHFFAAFIAMFFIGSVIILSRGRGMGWGDFKLVGALGLIFGWPDILMVLFLSFIIGSLFVLPLLISRRKGMKDAVPFGPFLIIAAALTFFFGFQIIDAYFKFFNFLIK